MENIKILVIENDDFVINDIRQMLKSCGFAPPRITGSGEEGLRFVESFAPDLVIMGLVLRGSLDGIEVYEHIHSEYDVPVIFLTERDEIDILKYVGISESYGYLFKPFIERELYANIRLALTIHNTEKKLNDSEEKFQLLTQSFPATIYLRKNDNNQTPLFLGDSVEALSGYTREEFMDATVSLTDLIHPEDLLNAQQRINDAIENQASFRAKYRIRHKAGDWQSIEDVGNPVFHGDELIFIEGFLNPLQLSDTDAPDHSQEQNSSGLNDLLDTCTEGLVVHNDGKIAYINRSALRIFGGLTKDDLKGKRILDFVHPDYHKTFKNQIYYEQSDSELKFHREKFVKTNGEIVDVELAGSPLIFNAVPSIQLVIRDITSKLQQESEQKLEQDRYSLAQKVTKMGYWEWIVSTEKMQISPHAKAMFGLQNGNFGGYFQDYLNLVLTEDRQRVKETISDCLEKGKDYSITHRITTSAGGVKYLSVKGNTVRDWQGKVSRIFGIMLDITQQKLLEDKVQQYRTRLGTLISHDNTIIDKIQNLAKSGHDILDQGSVILLMAEMGEDDTFATTYVSPNVAQLGERGKALLAGDIDLSDLIHPDDRESAGQTTAENISAGREYWEQEYRIITGDNDIRWINESTHFKKNSNDPKRKNFFIFISDVSRMKHIQQELQEKQNQLIHSGRLASLGELAAGVAHELNQPLAIIQSQAQILQIMSNKNEGIDQELKEDLNVIIEEVDRASDIIENMRDFSRVEYKTNGVINLVDPVEKSLMFFKKQFLNHNIELNTTYESNIPKLKINPQRFEQIVINFMTNARYAVEKRAEMESADYQGKIDLKLSWVKDQNAVALEVRDNGIGMNEETRKNCTEPFYTTKKADGTGLGLSIVSGIVGEFNGTLEIESGAGKGTTMRVFVPCDTEPTLPAAMPG